MQSEDRERPYRHIFDAIGDGLILQDVESHLVVEANPAASALYGYARQDFIGLPPTAIMPRASYAQFTGWVQAVRAGDSFAATVVHVRRDGTPFTVEVHGTRCIYRQRLCLLSVVRDVSARVQAEELLRQQVGARTREQSTLLEISQTLASSFDLRPGLILEQLRVLIAYTHAALFALQEPDLVALAVRGPRSLERAMPLRIRLADPEIQARLLNEQRPQRIANVWGSDPAAQFLQSLLSEGAEPLLEGVKAWMWVPLVAKGRFIGGIGMGHAAPDIFTSHEANLALTIANQAAIAMVNAELHAQAQALAALQERQRLTQNLHDAVNQSLFSAGLIAEVLPRLWEQDPEAGRQALEDLRRLTRGAMAEMRGLLAELRPMALTDAELADLLHQLADALTGRTAIPVAVTVTGQNTLPGEVQMAFYRVCQEALNNIAKHAGDCRVEIDLHSGAGTVELSIRDDGRGFDPARAPSGHYGLSIMREHARAVGATLSVASEPGQGTAIAISWRQERP